MGRLFAWFAFQNCPPKTALPSLMLWCKAQTCNKQTHKKKHVGEVHSEINPVETYSTHSGSPTSQPEAK